MLISPVLFAVKVSVMVLLPEKAELMVCSFPAVPFTVNCTVNGFAAVGVLESAIWIVVERSTVWPE